MIKDYNNVFTFHPIYVDLKFKQVVLEFLKAHRKDIEFEKERWFELLKIKEEDLNINISDVY